MTVEEALGELKAILGKGLYPMAIPKVEAVLQALKQDSVKASLEHGNDAMNEPL